MTTFVVEELKTDPLVQTINLKYDRVYHIHAVKLKLKFVGAPSGTFTVSFKQGVTTLTSETFTFSDIQSDLSSSNNNGYIFKVIDIDPVLRLKKGSFNIELSSSGYTFSESSYLAWSKSYENIFNEREDDLVNIQQNPLDVLIYEKVRSDLR